MVKGSHHTKKTIEKMSIIKKGIKYPPGRVGWNKGKTTYRRGLTLEQEYGAERAEEIRQNLSKSHKGNLGYWEGKKFTEKHRNNISEGHKGQIAWNKGLAVETDERVRQNIEAATKTIREQYENGKISPRLGFKATKETRRRNSEAMKGEKNPNWIDGKSEQYKRKIAEREWKQIATRIRKRDCFTCQNCYEQPAYQVHHLIPFRLFHNDNENNLITLCRSCHGFIEHNTEFIKKVN